MRLLNLLVLALILSPCPSNAAEWKAIGPPATNITNIIPDRQHPNVWYAIGKTNYTGRLYVSNDAANTWRPLPIQDVREVHVHPKTSEVFVLSYKQTAQIWHSRNLGKSFQLRASLPFSVQGIRLDPYNSRIFAFGFDKHGLAVSADGGVHWRPIHKLPYRLGSKVSNQYPYCVAESYTFNDLIVSPFDPKILYSTGWLYSPCGPYDYLLTRFLLKSASGGEQWVVAEEVQDFEGDEDISLYKFHTDPLYPQRVLAIGRDSIKRLSPSGWEKLSSKGGFDRVISIPEKPTNLLAVSLFQYYPDRVAVFKSEDEGRTWHESSILLPKGFQAMESVVDGQNGLFLGTTAQGLFYRNNQKSWTPINNGILEASVNRVLSAPGYEQIYALLSNDACCAPDSVFKLSPAGRWTNIGHRFPPLQLSSYAAAINPNNPQHLILEATKGYLITKDGGASWQKVAGGFTALAFARNRPDTVYFASKGSLYKSSEGGLNPKKVSDDVPKLVFEIVVDPFDSNILFVLSGTGLDKSVDGGRNFTGITPNSNSCPDTHPSSMAPLSQPNAFVLNNGCGDVYRTFDGGLTWELLAKKALSLGGKIGVADPAGNHLYLAYGNLMESIDGGRTWKNISAELGPAFRGRNSRTGFVWDFTDPQSKPFYVATSLGIFERQN